MLVYEIRRTVLSHRILTSFLSRKNLGELD